MGIHDSNRTIVIWDKAKLGALVQINRNVDMGKSLYLESFNCCCSVAKSGPTLRPHGLQHAGLPCPLPSPGVCSNSCTLSWWCYLTISSFAAPFSFNLSEKQYLYQWVSSSHKVAKGLEFQLQHQSFQWIPGTDLL